MSINKDQVIYGIEIMSQIETAYRNGRYPSSLYWDAVTNVKKILIELLKIKEEYKVELKDDDTAVKFYELIRKELRPGGLLSKEEDNGY